MINPSFQKLSEISPSRYEVCVMVMKRAALLVDGSEPLVESEGEKPVTVAIDEIMARKVRLAESDEGRTTEDEGEDDAETGDPASAPSEADAAMPEAEDVYAEEATTRETAPDGAAAEHAPEEEDEVGEEGEEVKAEAEKPEEDANQSAEEA